MIELVFKRGQQPPLADVEEKMGAVASLVPNYTLISERGVKVLDQAEEILEIFSQQRLRVVKRRYELLVEDYTARIQKNNEIIRFIRERHYAQAEKKNNRKDFVDYLDKQKFVYSEYLADMAIYRMTKEEVEKRELLIKEESKLLKEYQKIAKSDSLVQDKLIEELNFVDEELTKIMTDKEKEKKQKVIQAAKGVKKKKATR